MNSLAALAELDLSSVTRLADLIEAGYLKPPFTALSLHGHVAEDRVRSVADCLDTLAAPPESAAAVVALRAYVAGRAAQQDPAASVEIVASGPDEAALARDTGVVVRQLFAQAHRNVLAVGFAVHQGRTVFKVLADRLDADAALDVTFCIDVHRPNGDTSRADQVVARFAAHFVEREWPGTRLPTVYYDPRSLASGGTRSALHAKCVVVDGQAAFVTSANFTEAAQQRNIELGLLVQSRSLAAKIETHFQTLIRCGRLVRLPMLGG